MAAGFLNSFRRFIGLKETQFSAAVSSNVARKLGSSVNWINDNTHFLPVGSIVSSLLDEANFYATKSNSFWVLCDGRNVAGSQYQTVTGNANVPDMRGLFLRGKNNGQAFPTGGNPNADEPLGTYEPGSFQSHTHLVGVQQPPNSNGFAAEDASIKVHNWYDFAHDAIRTPPYKWAGGDQSIFDANVVVTYLQTINSGGGILTQSIGPVGSSFWQPAAVVLNFYIKINNYVDNTVVGP